MSWASNYISVLQAGKHMSFRPRGNSMTPKIKSGQLVTIEPYTGQPLFVGDVVLCRVSGNDYLHLISAIDGDRVQISNNHGFVNGWTNKSKIYGRLVAIYD